MAEAKPSQLQETLSTWRAHASRGYRESQEGRIAIGRPGVRRAILRRHLVDKVPVS